MARAQGHQAQAHVPYEVQAVDEHHEGHARSGDHRRGQRELQAELSELVEVAHQARARGQDDADGHHATQGEGVDQGQIQVKGLRQHEEPQAVEKPIDQRGGDEAQEAAGVRERGEAADEPPEQVLQADAQPRGAAPEAPGQQRHAAEGERRRHHLPRPSQAGNQKHGGRPEHGQRRVGRRHHPPRRARSVAEQKEAAEQKERDQQAVHRALHRDGAKGRAHPQPLTAPARARGGLTGRRAPLVRSALPVIARIRDQEGAHELSEPQRQQHDGREAYRGDHHQPPQARRSLGEWPQQKLPPPRAKELDARQRQKEGPDPAVVGLPEGVPEVLGPQTAKRQVEQPPPDAERDHEPRHEAAQDSSARRGGRCGGLLG